MSPDENRVLQLLAQGYSFDEMAWLLNISRDKVRKHVQSLLVRYRVHSKLELVSKTAPRHSPKTLKQKGTPVTPLTPNEERVRAFYVFGCEVDEMAVLLDASPDEVRGHVQSILTKFEVQSRLELLSKTGMIWP